MCLLPHLIFSFHEYCAHRDLHSFPTRRSSDLTADLLRPRCSLMSATEQPCRCCISRAVRWSSGSPASASASSSNCSWRRRSEEHTSELQSLRHLVCRLLLEKKNKKKNQLNNKS